VCKTRIAQRGSALIEFVLAAGLLLVPLLLGTVVFGLNLIRANQVTSVCRDAAHMFSYDVDFSLPASQNLLIRLAQGLNMTTTGGNGVIILSKLTYVDPSDCTDAGITAADCSNSGEAVVVKRLYIGQKSLHSSAFATPADAIVDASTGDIKNTNYLKNTSAQAVDFHENVMSKLTSGHFAYMAEMFVTSPDYSFGNTFGSQSISARSIF
jgi:hypothetical protein